MTSLGTLYLIPSPLCGEECLDDIVIEDVLPLDTIRSLRSLSLFFVENVRFARRFLKKAGHPSVIAELEIVEINKQTPRKSAPDVTHRLLAGADIGVITEGGYPCIADPGEELVLAAHRAGCRVAPLVGPSSILLAIVGSGLTAERFMYHGYLPRLELDLFASLKKLEQSSQRERRSEVFIETPYRAPWLMSHLCAQLDHETFISRASSVATPREEIITMPVRAWRNVTEPHPKMPCVFVIERKR
jgi:16S rRNA (cytidine1402-2'-O)-methyltransferase